MARKARTIPRPRTSTQDAIILNNATYDDYCARFYEIATSIFEWENLPDSCDARYLERVLYYNGMAALLKTAEYGFINTKAACNGDLNIYGLPTSLNCYSYSFNEIRRVYNGITDYGLNPDYQDTDKSNNECILVMNNTQRIPTFSSMRLFALRLTEVERTIDTNIKRLKLPYIITGSKQQEFSLRNIYNAIDNNEPALIVDKDNISLRDINAIELKVPVLANELMLYKKEIVNEALTVLGVNNLSEKRERLISDETNTNNEMINYNLMSYLAPRQVAAEQFNEKYGLTGDKKVTVKIRSDLDNIIKKAMSIVSEEYAEEELKREAQEDLGVKENGEI